MATTTAAILSCEATTLVFDGGERLGCLYVVVDARRDPRVVDLLRAGHVGCDHGALDWQLVERPRSTLIGLELAHVCDDPGLRGRRLRLVFDLARDGDALDHLAATEALVVGTREYGSFANTVCAFGVDGDAVRRTVDAARRGLVPTAADAGTA